MLFIMKVQSAAFSGLESYVLNNIDYKALDSKMLGMLRSMMCGKACSWELHPKRMTDREVWRFWRLSPSNIELRVRRLPWVREVVRRPATHQQYLVAVFGHFPFEEGPTVEESGLLSHSPTNTPSSSWMIFST